MAKTIWTNGKENIEVKGGVSLRAIEDAVSEAETNTVGEITYNVDSKKLEAYAVRYAIEIGLLEKEDLSWPDSWSGNGVFGIDDVSYALGLESNSLRNSGWGFCYLGEEKGLSGEQKAARYLSVAQFIGFVWSLEAEYEDGKKVYPALAAIQRRARSGRGHNSPATGVFVHEYAAVRYKMNKGNKSPGALERKIWAVKEAALRKHNVHISFETALQAIGVVGLHAVGKAATVAAAIHYSADRNFKNYREAREWLVDFILARRNGEQVVDGVRTLSIGVVAKKGGITVKTSFAFQTWYYGRGWKKGYLFTHPIEGTYHAEANSLATAWRNALAAFKRRKASRLSDAQIQEALNPADRCHLVWLQDSFDAGNCRPGTEAWMGRHGFEGKKLAPLTAVYQAAKEDGDNHLALNVVKMVAAEVTAEQVA